MKLGVIVILRFFDILPIFHILYNQWGLPLYWGRLEAPRTKSSGGVVVTVTMYCGSIFECWGQSWLREEEELSQGTGRQWRAEERAEGLGAFSSAEGRPRAVRALSPSAVPHSSRGRTLRSPTSKPGLGSSHRGEPQLLESDLCEAPAWAAGSFRVTNRNRTLRGQGGSPRKC